MGGNARRKSGPFARVRWLVVGPMLAWAQAAVGAERGPPSVPPSVPPTTDFHAPKKATSPVSQPRATLLIVGDSLVGGPFALARMLREKLAVEGVRVAQDTWVGVGVQRFARDRRLRDLMVIYKPRWVVVVLGTNDYALPSPDRAVPAIERIVKTVSAQSCAWVGPLVPNDTGIVHAIAAHTSPCVMIDSRRFGVATTRDGVHPTIGGSRFWAENVLTTLREAGWNFNPAPESLGASHQDAGGSRL